MDKAWWNEKRNIDLSLFLAIPFEKKNEWLNIRSTRIIKLKNIFWQYKYFERLKIKFQWIK